MSVCDLLIIRFLKIKQYECLISNKANPDYYSEGWGSTTCRITTVKVWRDISYRGITIKYNLYAYDKNAYKKGDV